MNKISIRFYKDHKVRAVWDEEHNRTKIYNNNVPATIHN